MSKIRTSCNPVSWKSQMLNGVEPTRQSVPVTVFEPYKRTMTRDFDFVTPRGYVDDTEVNSLDAFEATPVSNLSEAKRLCSVYNHKHLRKTDKPLFEADLTWRRSLREFNLCGNCMLPLRTKHETIKQANSVEKLETAVPVTVEYADVLPHYVVVPRDDKPNKLRCELVPKHRVFNQKCGCGI